MKSTIVRVLRRVGIGRGQSLQPESAFPLLLIVAFITIGAVRQGGGPLRVVNLVPRALSYETKANHEPYLAVNPASPEIMVATAHNIGRGFCRSGKHAPLLLSINGGTKWWVVCAVTAAEGQNVQDGTVQFSANGSALFAGTLQSRDAESGDMTNDRVYDAYILGIRRSELPDDHWASIVEALSSWPDAADDTPMSVLLKRKHSDQPLLATAGGGDDQVVAVGANDFHMWSDDAASICRTGAVYLSTAPFDKGFTEHCVAKRRTASAMPQTPAVRTAVHQDGTVYALFYRPVFSGHNVDVVVVRADPDQLDSANPFEALKDLPDTDADDTAAGTEAADCDRRDGKPGIRVATCMRNPFIPGSSDEFGQERRVHSQLSIAVHPTSSNTVYIAWASSVIGAPVPRLQLHVQVSTDRGENWSDRDRLILANATNPALAIASDGTVGLLYQRLSSGSCPGSPVRWETRLDLFEADFTLIKSTELASVKACEPAGVGVPYIGDYLRLQAVGNSFFGVFSASNDLATSSFPADFTFQRRYAGTELKDGSGNVVPVSIDPYFFRFIR